MFSNYLFPWNFYYIDFKMFHKNAIEKYIKHLFL